MTTSKYELDFLEPLRRCERGEIAVSSLAAVISSQLEELSRWASLMGEDDEAKEIDGLWEQFNFIAGDSTATADELDEALAELYNWADSPAAFDGDGNPISGVILCRVKSS
jgi:hypothetical protein